MTAIEKTILAVLISSASVMASYISPELTLIKNHFSLASHQLNKIMTLYLAGYLSGQVVWAFISNKIGRVISIKIGMSISILGAIIIIISTKTMSFDLFLIARLLIAFGLASGLVCGFTMIKENLSEQESKQYISIIAFVFSASVYLSILLSGYIVKYTSLDFLMWSILSYASAMFFFCFCIESYPKKAISCKKSSYSIDLKLQTNTLIFSLILSITTIISYCYALYAPVITYQILSLTPTEFSLCSLINMFFIFLGGILYHKLGKKISEELILSLGLLLIIMGCLSLLLLIKHSVLTKVFGFFSFCSLLNLLTGLIYPAATYKALQHGRCKSTSSAIMNLIKLTMPMVAIYVSSYFPTEELTLFISTILFFAVLYLLILQLTKIIPPKLSSNEFTQ